MTWPCPEEDVAVHAELGEHCVDPEACASGATCAFVRATEARARQLKDDINPQNQALHDALANWWITQAEAEMMTCIPKAIEYGSTDLAVIGRTMGRLMGRNGEMTHEEATEIGIYFYLVGKLARWEDAITHGRRVSDDTLHDIAVYLKMQQRNRAVGGWPFAPGEDN